MAGEARIMMSPGVMEQLAEIRSRLLMTLFSMAAFMVGLYALKERILAFLLLPLQQYGYQFDRVVFSSVTELFFVYLKLTTWGGVFLAMPILFFQVWKFLSPGLYGHERKFVAPLLAATPLLFYAGGCFAYFAVLPLALRFFLGFEQPGVSAMPNVSLYLDMLFNFGFAFGLAFNLPVVLLLLVKIGLIRVETLRKWRRFAIVAIFIFSALITPPDPFSQLMLAFPLIALYELAILAASRLVAKK